MRTQCLHRDRRGRASAGVLAVLVVVPAAAAAQPPGVMPAPPAAAPLAPLAAPPAELFETLSFAEAVNRAVSRNAQIKVVQADVARAEAQLEQTRASLMPVVSASGSYTLLDGDRKLGNTVILAQSEFAANVTLSVPVYAPQRWADRKRSADAIQVSRMTVEDSRRAVAMAASRAYLTVVSRHHAIEVTERARAVAQRHVELAQARSAAGVGGRLDETLAQQEVASDLSSLRLLESELDQAREALGTLTGGNAPVEAQASVQLSPQAAAALDQALDQALAKRADLVLINAKLEAAEWSAGHSWTDRAPLLSALVQPFFQSPPTLTMPRFGWQAELVLSIPLFDGGLSSGLKHQREAEIARDRAEQEEAVREVRSEVRVAVRDIRQAEAALAAAREASRLADASLALTSEAYRVGSATSIEVIDIERRAKDAATAVVVAEDTVWQARLEYLFSIGELP